MNNVHFQVGTKDFSLFHDIQTDSYVPASLLYNGYQRLFPLE
jgi:hypothetical protein